MELINCSEKYWDFVRKLRTHPDNIKGFITQKSITTKEQKLYMAVNHHFFKICLQNGTPVGYIGLIGPERDEITLAVDPHSKSSGVGSFMIRTIVKTHKSLWAKVKNDNHPSIRLFQKLGFSKKIKNDFIFFHNYES